MRFSKGQINGAIVLLAMILALVLLRMYVF